MIGFRYSTMELEVLELEIWFHNNIWIAPKTSVVSYSLSCENTYFRAWTPNHINMDLWISIYKIYTICTNGCKMEGIIGADMVSPGRLEIYSEYIILHHQCCHFVNKNGQITNKPVAILKP